MLAVKMQLFTKMSVSVTQFRGWGSSLMYACETPNPKYYPKLVFFPLPYLETFIRI